MTKIRRFEVNREKEKDKYIVTVGDEPAKVEFSQMVMDEMRKYHPDLNTEDEIILMVMQELVEYHNLSEDEYCEYTQTLKYILKD